MKANFDENGDQGKNMDDWRGLALRRSEGGRIANVRTVIEATIANGTSLDGYKQFKYRIVSENSIQNERRKRCRVDKGEVCVCTNPQVKT